MAIERRECPVHLRADRRGVTLRMVHYGHVGQGPAGLREAFMGPPSPLPETVPVNLQHDPALTLDPAATVTERDDGQLHAEAVVPEGVRDLIRRGSLRGASVEMVVNRDRVEADPLGAPVRRILEWELLGAGIVHAGAAGGNGLELRRRFAALEREARQAGRIRGRLPLGRRVDCVCGFRGRAARRQAIVEEIDLSGEVTGYLGGIERPLGPATTRRGDDGVDVEIEIADGLSYGGDALALANAGTRFAVRPFPNFEASRMTSDGDLDVYALLIPAAWIVVATSLAGDLPAADVEAEQRRLRRKLRWIA